MGHDDELRLAFEAAGVGMYAFDERGAIVLANRACADLLGFSVDELIGQRAHPLVHHSRLDGTATSVDTCPIFLVSRTGVADQAELDTFWRRDGTPLPVWWVAAPIAATPEAAGRASCVCVFGDARDRRDAHALADAERMRAAAEAENARLTTLTALSELLNSLDVLAGLDRVAEMVSSGLADACIIDRIDGEGRIRRVSLSAAGRPSSTLSNELHPMPLLSERSEGSLARVLTSRSSEEIVDLAGDIPASDPLDREQAALFARLADRHAVVLPLGARGRMLGAMTWTRSEASGRFAAADLLMARLFALRIGQWMENLRLNELQQDAALAFQRSLLTAVPEPDHLEIVARYVPAGEGVEVGGDWYDALLSHDRHTVIAIGDVSGHDVTAAARMAQLRNMTRFAALHQPLDPSRTLREVDRALPALAIRTFASIVLGAISINDDGGRRFTWSNAGHPPPLLVERDGSARLLERSPNDLLLGVNPTTRRSNHRCDLPDGATLVLYTDGLVERRDESLTAGLERLQTTATGLAGQNLAELCDGLIKQMSSDNNADDLAIVAVRMHPQDPPRPPEAGPEVVPTLTP